jgi:hypothetical protein
MTRKSRREIETDLDELRERKEFTLQDYMWADLKDAHDSHLSRGERRLLKNPEAYLPPSAVRSLCNLGDSQ